jgi:phosphatidylglycerol---prolipoprotein diacylglyceryl transferase
MHPIIPCFERIVFTLPEFLGSLQLHGFGILVASGFLLASQLGQRKCRRDGLDPEVINKMLVWIVAGVFIGGHLGHALMYDPVHYWEHPMELLHVWQGLSSFGGFFASALFVYFFFKRSKVPIWPYADIVAYGLSLGWFLGRMGCTAAHDHPGRVSEFFLAVPGMCPVSSARGGVDCFVACHDLGFYEALFTLGMLLAFLWLDRKPRFAGFYMGWMITSYAPVRFGMDFLRHPSTDVRYFGLTPAQYGSMVMLSIGIWILLSRRNKPTIQQIVAAARGG